MKKLNLMIGLLAMVVAVGLPGMTPRGPVPRLPLRAGSGSFAVNPSARESARQYSARVAETNRRAVERQRSRRELPLEARASFRGHYDGGSVYDLSRAPSSVSLQGSFYDDASPRPSSRRGTPRLDLSRLQSGRHVYNDDTDRWEPAGGSPMSSARSVKSLADPSSHQLERLMSAVQSREGSFTSSRPSTARTLSSQGSEEHFDGYGGPLLTSRTGVSVFDAAALTSRSDSDSSGVFSRQGSIKTDSNAPHPEWSSDDQNVSPAPSSEQLSNASTQRSPSHAEMMQALHDMKTAEQLNVRGRQPSRRMSRLDLALQAAGGQ